MGRNDESSSAPAGSGSRGPSEQDRRGQSAAGSDHRSEGSFSLVPENPVGFGSRSQAAAAPATVAASEAPVGSGSRRERRTRRRELPLRSLVNALRGRGNIESLEVEVEVQEDSEEEDNDNEDENGRAGEAGEAQEEPQGRRRSQRQQTADAGADAEDDAEEGDEEEEAAQTTLVLASRAAAAGEEERDSGSGSESHSEVDVAAFREQLAPGDQSALTLWRSTVFRSQGEVTGECALAVARWVDTGVMQASQVDDEMLLCIVRVLERGYAMFEEEEDLVRVFTAAVALTEVPECADRMLERGALRAMIRGLQSSAHLLLDLAEETDWFETERLVRIYKAFKTLWQVCQSKPEGDSQRRCITVKAKSTCTELAFAALGKWLRGVPLKDVWIGEDDILVFWVLIPLWPSYLDHLEAQPTEKSAEEKGRFKEICNWVLWPNDPVIETGYRLIGHLDFSEGADFSLRFLLSEERFRWIVTPATKQRYLQYRVSQVAQARQPPREEGNEDPGLVLVVNRETPLQDLCKQLGVTGYHQDPVNLLGGITVHFRGVGDSGNEEGIDEGGPWREAIPLMFSELIFPNHGLFEVREDGETRTVEPRWCAAGLVPDYQAQFELFGMLVGMALVYQAYAPAHFSRCFLKHIFGLPRVLLEDQPSLDQQLRLIRSAAEDGGATHLDALCLTFSVDDATTGRSHDFVPGGASREVASAADVVEYCTLRERWELEGRFMSVMPHVHRGLHCVVPPDVLESFSQVVSPDELDVMLAGHGINIKDWREHTEYYGYDENSNVVSWFWEAVESFSAQEREDLWTFISGSKGVPPGGFGHLTNAAGEAIRFTIARVESSPDHLPVAHTCGYQLDLAPYATAEDLANKLRHAMSHRQGFGLA